MDVEDRKSAVVTWLSSCCKIAVIAFALLAASLAIIVVPTMFRPHNHTKSNCASNLKQIGQGLKMYLSDWNDTYPTNRPRLANGRLGPISCCVKLTKAGELDHKGKQKVFDHGLNWVEAMYQYVEPPSPDSNGAWECKAASTGAYPEHSDTAYTTYVLNRNLVERPETCVRESDRTLLAREMDRHVNAELRPTNYSCGRPDAPPMSPFLTTRDSRIGQTEAKLHGMGSHILFADSHVQFFNVSYIPEQTDITAKRCWDAKQNQWRVVIHSTPYTHVIAITP